MTLGAFAGRVVLITGASSGIGRAAARAYAAQGAHMVLAARREEPLREAALEVEAFGVRALPVRCDIPQPADVERGFTETEFRQTRLHAEGWRQSPTPRKQMSADAGAQAMVRASRRHRRDTILTLPGRLMVRANRFAPSLFDRVARRMVTRMAKRPEP